MNLAHNSRYGVLTEERVILQSSLPASCKEADVLLVSIADAQGRVLAQRFKDRHQVASPGLLLYSRPGAR